MEISEATRRNWKRLAPDLAGRLMRGANKTRSGRTLFPKEYLLRQETRAFIEKAAAIRQAKHLSTEETLFTVASRMLTDAGIAEKPGVRKTLSFCCHSPDPTLFQLPLPQGENDLLGGLYQSLLTEGEKNKAGSYYTPFRVVKKMMEGFPPNGGSVLDPCCGSGAFLLSCPVEDPEALWGCDSDPVAVLIARVNLLCKYPDADFVPKIFCLDYLSPERAHPLLRKKFDCIATNPPWGAKMEKGRNAADSSSRFFTKAYSQLKWGGRILFLFPEAVLNVRAHRPFREMLLAETHLNDITFFEENFTGVMTKYVSVDAGRSAPARTFRLCKGEETLKKEVQTILAQKEKIISWTDEKTEQLLRKISSAKKYDLSGSLFALGIVTGNNLEKVKRLPSPGMEPVFTGKEVTPYRLKNAEKYLFYRREEFQQAAPDARYRAPEKLVYKFISPTLVFAYDDRQKLVLNSANVLIPKIPGYGIKTVLAFLNSEVLRTFYAKRFHGVKVLKQHLLELPFPAITREENLRIEAMTERLLAGDVQEEEMLQRLIFDLYKLNGDEIRLIRQLSQK